MKISFYIPALHIGNISVSDFINGDIGLSGTDAQILNRAIKLNNTGVEVTVYTNSPGLNSEEMNINYSPTLKDAVLSSKNNSELIVFNNRGNEETIEGIKSCEQNKMPCVVWDQNGPSEEIKDLLARCSFVKRLVCVSRSQLDYTRDHPVFYKTTYIYNSIDTASYYSSEKINGSLCYLGSLTPSKGFHHLAKAWKRIKDKCPGAKLTVIGSGKLYDRNQKLGELDIAEEAYEKNFIIPFLGNSLKEIRSAGVSFLGLQSPNEIKKILAATEVGVVNPNLKGSTETFCVSAVEIQASKCVVVGANRGGLRETIINNKTGFLINREIDLVTKIVSFITNKSLRKQMGEEAKLHVERMFDENHINKKWMILLEEIAINKRQILIPFSLKRATFKILIREVIRYLRKVPFVGKKVPTLNQFKK